MRDRRTLGLDGGGTNVRVGFAHGSRLGAPLELEAASFGGPLEVLQAAIEKAGAEESPEAVCLGLAGPVRDGHCRPTHLAWDVRQRDLEAALGVPVRLVNDVEAQAWGFATLLQPMRGPSLQPGDVRLVLPGRDSPSRRVVLVAIGTGLGVGLLARSGATRRLEVISSEGGHGRAAWRPETAALLEWAHRRTGREPTWEDVLSGRGLGNLYFHEVSLEPRQEDPTLSERVAAAGKDAGRHVGLAADQGDAPSQRAIARFWSLAAFFCADAALAFDADHVVLCGGVVQRREASLDPAAFRQAFVRHPQKEDTLRSVPVDLVTHPHLGVLGANVHAQDWL